MGEAIELYKKDGTTAGIFYCSECRIVFGTKEEAQKCHGELLCSCGQKVEDRFGKLCRSCCRKEWQEKEAAKERERFEKAQKIAETEYRGEMVFLDDKYFDSVEDAIDDYLEGQEPEYVWACKDVGVPKASAESIYENLLNNMWEDAEVGELEGVAELEAAVSAFNKANESINVWMPDFATAVLVTKREVLS